jgi:hypothetical protein
VRKLNKLRIKSRQCPLQRKHQRLMQKLSRKNPRVHLDPTAHQNREVRCRKFHRNRRMAPSRVARKLQSANRMTTRKIATCAAKSQVWSSKFHLKCRMLQCHRNIPAQMLHHVATFRQMIYHMRAISHHKALHRANRLPLLFKNRAFRLMCAPRVGSGKWRAWSRMMDLQVSSLLRWCFIKKILCHFS